jgi:hypothetical protein
MANEKDDNDVKQWVVHRSSGIYIVVEESHKKLSWEIAQ